MSSDRIPKHVAVIMDGNGRWAEFRSKPRYAGHRAGIGPVRETVEHAARRGVSRLTLFAFSSENWGRPHDEVSRLMGLFHEALQREVDELHSNRVRLRFIGDRSMLRQGLRDRIVAAEDLTAGNDGLGLNIAVAYGGRWDITNAAKRIAERVERGEMRAADFNEAEFARGLELAGEPDVDLLIRTGGERRISNFLLWNLAYAELYFTDCLWPDFNSQEFDAALSFFESRERRYGHTGKQLGVA